MKTTNPYRALTKPMEITKDALTVIDNLGDGDLLVAEIGSDTYPASSADAEWLNSLIKRVLPNKRIGVLIVPYVYKIRGMNLK